MANGMPLSAVVGKREIMKRFQPPNNIFYSGTMFGETLSLAAGIATIKKMEREHVIQHLWKVGAEIMVKVDKSLEDHGLTDIIQFSGMYPRKKINFKDHESATANQIKTMFLQEMARNGVLIINANNVSYAMKGPEVKRIATAYDETLWTIAGALDCGQEAVKEMIDKECQAFDPLRKS
jgi:glutamate-1-semialdehyde 2,1-aminomutase